MAPSLAPYVADIAISTGNSSSLLVTPDFADLVGVEIEVEPDGTVDYLFGSDFLDADFDLGANLDAPIIPAGSTVTSATLTFSDLQLGVQNIRGGIATAHGEIDQASFATTGAACDNGLQYFYPQTAPHSFNFVPCAGPGGYQVRFTGSAGLHFDGLTIPSYADRADWDCRNNAEVGGVLKVR